MKNVFLAGHCKLENWPNINERICFLTVLWNWLLKKHIKINPLADRERSFENLKEILDKNGLTEKQWKTKNMMKMNVFEKLLGTEKKSFVRPRYEFAVENILICKQILWIFFYVCRHADMHIAYLICTVWGVSWFPQPIKSTKHF